MPLFTRLARLLGRDTITERVREEPLYEYTIIHSDSQTKTIYAHGYRIDGAFLKFYEYRGITRQRYNENKVSIPFNTIHLNRIKTRTLDSVKEITEKEIATHSFKVKYDRADYKIIETNIPDVPEDGDNQYEKIK